MRYSPCDILRKFVLRQCIEHLVVTSEVAVWVNFTFWENVTNKAYAQKCWNKLKQTFVEANPDFRFVGIWARQRRGAWHIHGVCNQRFDLKELKSWLYRSGFGVSHWVQELDGKQSTPERIARYISGYCTDKNGLDPVKDKGVRRTIFVGKHTRVVDMRYKSSLKRVTSIGRELAKEIEAEEQKALSEFERGYSLPRGRKRGTETWGDWYRRNRDYWVALGWDSLSKAEKQEMLELDQFCSRYFETGRWSFV
jgi:hypothetical protein